MQIKPTPFKESFDAPIEKGAVLGTADIYYAGEKLGTVNLVAADARQQNVVLVVWRYITDALTSTAFKIVLLVVALIIIGFIIVVILMNRKRKKRRYHRGSKGYKKY